MAGEGALSPAAGPPQLFGRPLQCARVRGEFGVPAAGTSPARGISCVICRQPSNTCVLILIAPAWPQRPGVACGKGTLILKGISGLGLYLALQLGG